MTMNRIIPIIGGIILLMALAVVFKSGHRKPEPAMLSQVPKPPEPDADTPADTVRSLSAKVAALVEQTKKLTEENERLRQENNEYRMNEDRIVSKVRSKLSEDVQRAKHQDNQMISNLQAELERLRNRLSEASSRLIPPSRGGKGRLPESNPDMPVGFGYGPEGATMQGVHWIEPLDAPEPKSSAKRRVSFTGAQRTTGTSGSLLHPVESAVARTFSDDGPLSSRPIREHKGVTIQGSGQNKPNVVPVYTIPANATLLNSTAFSALVGRVPIGGKVQDPMPFKVLIGADNLAANGHHIPGLQGIVMSGYAIGDWTLSCVRGTLTSATFVFDDGHVVVFGEKKRGRTKDQEQDAIGWISDEFGVPCVSGKKITNAPTYLTERVGMVAAQAAAEAAAASQTTTTTSPTFGGSSTTTVTGDQGTYILGKTLSGATKEIGQWLEERMANSFDAVFAPAGTKVAVHLDVTLPIDYDPAGRMLDHRAAAAGPGGAYGYLD